ncbi:AraC family transcriptional regulator [Marinilabiliaceae bacterium JC017]|nr:AraC family transcriptional regulator [Marinilabiliaceae bacterium JC017]
MKLNALSISQFKQHTTSTSSTSQINSLLNDIIITNNIEYSGLFKYPCRLDAITMFICLGGEITSTVNLKKCTLTANSVFINLPEDIIQIESMKDLEAYAIIVSHSFLREANIDLQKILPLYLGIKQNPMVYISDKELELLHHYYILAQDAMEANDYDCREIMKGLLTALIYKILSFVKQKQLNTLETNKQSTQRNEITFDTFISLLNTHHTQEKTVKFYAEQMHITPKYLSKVVKDFSGKTAAEWIVDYVVLEAKTLLKFSNMSIQQVAYHLNFATQSSFGKYFKQQTGMSPKKFIEQ